MRKFTEREKTIIKSFIDINCKERVVNASDVYVKIFQKFNNAIGLDLAQEKLYYYSDNPNLYPLTYVEQELIDITLLFKYLDELNYLKFIKQNEEYVGINIDQKGNRSERQMISEEIALLVKHYWNCKIYITSTMYDLVANNFKTIEDLSLEEAQKQVKQSRTTMIISVIACVFSFVSVLISALK